MNNTSQYRWSCSRGMELNKLTEADFANTPATHVPLTGARKSLEPTKRNLPTLLNIPQELRDQIFTCVYSPADPNAIIDLRIVPQYTESDDELVVQAGTFLSEELPPTKDSLLICRQLYTEMRQTQSHAYRRFWSSRRFHVTTTRAYILDKLRLASEIDLRHIRVFVFNPAVDRHLRLLITFRFEAPTAWSVAVERYPAPRARPGDEVPWHLTECAKRDAFVQGLRDMLDTVRQGGDMPATTVDPIAGQGFGPDEMYELSKLVWHHTYESGRE